MTIAQGLQSAPHRFLLRGILADKTKEALTRARELSQVKKSRAPRVATSCVRPGSPYP